MSDVEIPAFQFPHAHALIKFHRPGVITVHIQAHQARFRMDAPDVADSVAEQKASDVQALEAGQNVDFLQMEDAGAFRLDGQVAAVPAFMGDDEVHVPLLHLFFQVGGGIHPVHHEIHLLSGKEVPVSGRKSLAGQFMDQRDVVLRGLAESRHVRNITWKSAG